MLTKRRVIGVAGRIASNKSSVAESLGRHFGTKPVSFGDFCRKVARQSWGREDRQLLQDIGGTLVKHPREFSARVLESSEVDLNKDIVIEGIRHVDVYESLQNLLGPAEYDLVYVNASEREILSRLRDEHTPEIAIPELEKDETEEEVRDVLPKLASITVGWREGLEAEDLSGQVLASINERLARVKLLQEYQKLDWAKYHRLVEKKALRRLTTDERVEMEGFLKAIEQFDQQEEFDSRYKFERAIDAHQRYLRSVDRLIDGLESWVKPYEVH